VRSVRTRTIPNVGQGTHHMVDTMTARSERLRARRPKILDLGFPLGELVTAPDPLIPVVRVDRPQLGPPVAHATDERIQPRQLLGREVARHNPSLEGVARRCVLVHAHVRTHVVVVHVSERRRRRRYGCGIRSTSRGQAALTGSPSSPCRLVARGALQPAGASAGACVVHGRGISCPRRPFELLCCNPLRAEVTTVSRPIDGARAAAGPVMRADRPILFAHQPSDRRRGSDAHGHCWSYRQKRCARGSLAEYGNQRVEPRWAVSPLMRPRWGDPAN
jgi:hypothetical protein